MSSPVRIPVQFDPQLLDPDALKVIRRITQHGFEAYLVGGCVRDLLLGEHPKDFDVATSAKPNELRKMFRNCRIIGRRFRLAHILFADKKVIEVATFRANREPQEVAPPSAVSAEAPHKEAEDLLIIEDNTFGDAESDALRRDFTLNALFYDVNAQEVIDYVGGMEHIQKRLVVAIGDPWIRFREDPVRIMRGIKFAARLNLTLEDTVRKAMADCHAEIVKSSKARVVEETFKILGGKGVHDSFRQLHEFGILQYIAPFLVIGQEITPDYWNALRALEWGVQGFVPSEFSIPQPPTHLRKPTRALLFASLMAPLMRRDLYDMKEGRATFTLRQQLHNQIQNWGTSINNPRRDTYRVQQMMVALERLWQGAEPEHHPRKRRRMPAAKLAQRVYFSEALQFMWILGAAWSSGKWDLYDSWAAWKDVVPGHDDSFPGRRSSSQPQQRRGGRRRRRQRYGQAKPEIL